MSNRAWLFLLIVVTWTSGAFLGISPAATPYWDDWEVCRVADGSIGWLGWIVEPHLEHFMPLPRLIILVGLKLVGVWPLWQQAAGIALLVLANLRIVQWLIQTGSSTAQAVVAGLVVGIPSAWENLSMGWQFHLLGAYFLSVLCLTLVAHRPWLALAAFACAIVSYAGSNGLTPALLLSFLSRPSAQRRWSAVVVTLLLLVLSAGLSSRASGIDASIANMGGSSPILHPVQLVMRAAGLVGASLLPYRTGLAPCVALGVVVVLGAVLAARASKRSEPWYFVLAAATYVLAVSWGRNDWGNALVGVSRYYVFPRLILVPYAMLIPALAVGVPGASGPLRASYSIALFVLAALLLPTGASWLVALSEARSRHEENTAAFCCLTDAAHSERERRVCAAEVAPNPARALSCLSQNPQSFALSSAACRP